MKKLMIMVGTMIVIISSVFITNSIVNKMQYIDVTAEEVKEKIEKNESFVLYVYSPFCSFCKIFTPRINQIIKEQNIDVFALDISKSSNWIEEFSKDGTPNLIIIENGKEKVRQLGAKEKDETLDYLKKNASFLDISVGGN